MAPDRHDVRFAFQLPEALISRIGTGSYGMAHVDAQGWATVKGHARDFVLHHADRFLRRVAPGLTLSEPIAAAMQIGSHSRPYHITLFKGRVSINEGSANHNSAA